MTDSGGAPPWSYVGPKGPVDRPEPPPPPPAATTPGASSEPPQGGGEARRRVGRRLVAVAVVVLVLAGGAAVAVARRESAPSHPDAWDPRVVDFVAFVERERKLTFKHPVHVDFLPPSEFATKTDVSSEINDDDRETLRRLAGELRAFGLIAGNVDIEKVLVQLSTQGVVGVYIPKDKRVYVRGTDLTPKVKGTLVHELTHALQDQHFDLRAIQEDEVNDTGVVSLIEGDAVRIEELYAQSLSAEDAALYVSGERQNLADANLEGIPRFFIQSFAFPYLFGPAFVTTHIADGDMRALDDAFRDPPSTEGEIINPSLFLEESVTKVDPPKIAAPDEAVADPLEFGMATTLYVLGARLGYQPAWLALQGWRGDNAQSFRRGELDCMAVAIQMDTAAHARALLSAATTWASSVPGATTGRRGRTVDLRSCDPGADGVIVATQSPDPFEVLQVRGILLAALVSRADLSARQASCGADAVIRELGPGAAVAVEGGSASAEQVRRLQEVAAAAAARC